MDTFAIVMLVLSVVAAATYFLLGVRKAPTHFGRATVSGVDVSTCDDGVFQQDDTVRFSSEDISVVLMQVSRAAEGGRAVAKWCDDSSSR